MIKKGDLPVARTVRKTIIEEVVMELNEDQIEQILKERLLLEMTYPVLQLELSRCRVDWDISTVGLLRGVRVSYREERAEAAEEAADASIGGDSTGSELFPAEEPTDNDSTRSSTVLCAGGCGLELKPGDGMYCSDYCRQNDNPF